MPIQPLVTLFERRQKEENWDRETRHSRRSRALSLTPRVTCKCIEVKFKNTMPAEPCLSTSTVTLFVAKLFIVKRYIVHSLEHTRASDQHNMTHD